MSGNNLLAAAAFRQKQRPSPGRPRVILSNAKHVRGVEALGTLLALELHTLAFVERLVAVLLDGGEMHKDILPG